MNNTIHIATSIYCNQTEEKKMLQRYVQGKDTIEKNASFE